MSDILPAIGEAKMRTALTVQALESLASLDEVDREKVWNAGAYRCWFGVYDDRRFRRIARNFRRTERALGRTLLKIDCGDEKDLWAEAWPGILKLTLHDDWRTAQAGDTERIQAIIHESAHISGVSIVKEDRFYGRTFSSLWAHYRPDITVRNADAYGYLALDPHVPYGSCKP